MLRCGGFLQQVVDEEATIQALVNMARRKQIEREANMPAGGTIKKPRYNGSSKPVARYYGPR
jgi:hypothetical protein